MSGPKGKGAAPTRLLSRDGSFRHCIARLFGGPASGHIWTVPSPPPLRLLVPHLDTLFEEGEVHYYDLVYVNCEGEYEYEWGGERDSRVAYS